MIAKTLFPQYAGPGAANRLRGTVLGDDGQPISRLIWLFEERGDVGGGQWPEPIYPRALTKSDSEGRYEFHYLPQRRYTLIAYDQGGRFDPVIKGGLTPEPME